MSVLCSTFRNRSQVVNLSAMRGNRLVVCVDEDVERARSFLHDFPEVRIVHTSDAEREVFQNPEVRAVVVSSPTDKHEDYIHRALDAGKAVFTEKPLSLTIEGTAKCYEHAKEAGQPLLVAFNRRFDNSFADLRNKLREGQIGNVHFLRSTARDNPVPSVAYLR